MRLSWFGGELGFLDACIARRKACPPVRTALAALAHDYLPPPHIDGFALHDPLPTAIAARRMIAGFDPRPTCGGYGVGVATVAFRAARCHRGRTPCRSRRQRSRTPFGTPGGAIAMNTDRGDVVRPCVPPFMRPVAQGPRVRRSAVGPFPVIAALVACGLLLAAFADQRGRAGRGGADTLFWIALATVIAPPMAARVVARDVKRLEALGLVVFDIIGRAVRGEGAKEPARVRRPRRVGHWRTTSDILATHHLFRLNPLIDTFGVFPGLASVTSAVASTAGVSIFHAGLIVVGAAKVVSVVALFLIYEQLGGSARLATVATLAYALNPNYLFFDASFCTNRSRCRSPGSCCWPLCGGSAGRDLRRSDGRCSPWRRSVRPSPRIT